MSYNTVNTLVNETLVLGHGPLLSAGPEALAGSVATMDPLQVTVSLLGEDVAQYMALAFAELSVNKDGDLIGGMMPKLRCCKVGRALIDIALCVDANKLVAPGIARYGQQWSHSMLEVAVKLNVHAAHVLHIMACLSTLAASDPGSVFQGCRWSWTGLRSRSS